MLKGLLKRASDSLEGVSSEKFVASSARVFDTSFCDNTINLIVFKIVYSAKRKFAFNFT